MHELDLRQTGGVRKWGSEIRNIKRSGSACFTAMKSSVKTWLVSKLSFPGWQVECTMVSIVGNWSNNLFSVSQLEQLFNDIGLYSIAIPDSLSEIIENTLE